MGENFNFFARKAHMGFCKERALKILNDTGDPIEAWLSFLSDMQKDEDTKNHSGLKMGMKLFSGGHLNSIEAMRNHIEGFK